MYDAHPPERKGLRAGGHTKGPLVARFRSSHRMPFVDPGVIGRRARPGDTMLIL